MALIFKKLEYRAPVDLTARNTAFLQPDNWDDYGHKTLFALTVINELGHLYNLGNLKIGFTNQTDGWTHDHMPAEFKALDQHYFSVGQDPDYYNNLIEQLPYDLVINILEALGDVAYLPDRLAIADKESSFNTSLLRTVNRNSIENQFKRIINQQAPLSEYNFLYEKPAGEKYSGLKLEFQVKPSGKPPSNIHILIGRNGVGKTSVLNNMVKTLHPEEDGSTDPGAFFMPQQYGLPPQPISDNYFAGLVSISFSAFDPFNPPKDLTDPNLGMRYSYVGLKKRIIEKEQEQEKWGLKTKEELCNDFLDSLELCLVLPR